MRPWHYSVVPLLLAALLTSGGYRAVASPTSVELPARSESPNVARLALSRRNGNHHHDPHAQPLLILNETELLAHHQATPPSYYTLDWEDQGHESRHGGMIVFHSVLMCLAFFVSLPLSITLRSLRHPCRGLAVLSFYGFFFLGSASASLYRKLTPNMYEGSAHGTQSYAIFLVAILTSTWDIISAVKRFVGFLSGSDRSLKHFYSVMFKDGDMHKAGPEYTGLISEEPEELDNPKISQDSVELQDVSLENTMENRTSQWADALSQHRRHHSTGTEHTIVNGRSPTGSSTTLQDTFHSPRSLLHHIGDVIIAVVERSLVVAGFAQLLVGFVVYTGGCRENYLNGCLAHLIKGGIFWCYGLVTFARFLGSYADLGWAWNRSPKQNGYSAEFVESFVIFLYGITNTWMERFGAHPGDPYTTKQIQHISIAVMFWFAGLVGMGIESKRIRKWLASSTFPAVSKAQDNLEVVTEPPSYSASFNPFPALVIGVTGAAMAAHFQTYLFQVQIHTLWGNLLLGFSVLRCLTYFFLWLGPPKSILPSRPPTEALGSFFLACGGLVFMLSTEEVTIAAMRRGRDDVMMFLNVAVAITCFAFCWTLLIVGFKGWMKSRVHAAITFRTHA